MIILAGDIGGTKTWLQIAEFSRPQKPIEETIQTSPIRECFSVLFERRFVSTEYDNFDAVLAAFLHAAQQNEVPLPELACIGVAGPVASSVSGNHMAKVTNLPWQLDAQKLAKQHHLRQLNIINDFQAVAFGLEMLADDELLVLQEGSAPEDVFFPPKVVIGAGTGLGQALLVRLSGPRSAEYAVIPSEGGHCDFAAGNDLQRDLLSYLATQQKRVTVEDVLSGRGLVNIYRFLVHKYPASANQALAVAMQNGDAAAAVGEAAISASDSLARQAVDLFVEIYGTQAGNYALTCMAKGGVYIAGGIACKLRECFKNERFINAFNDKAPMQELVKNIPVKLVLNEQTGLKGAALVASSL